MEAAVVKAGEMLTKYALSAAGAIVILIIGFAVAGLLARWTRGGLLKFRAIDLTLASFLSNIVKYAVLILVFVTVLAQFGVQTTSIIAALGAAGLAIGLALQGTLANIAAGIMLLVLRPFKAGEYIEASGINGTVQDIGLFTTELKQPDGLFVMAPNGQLWNRAIINYSRHPVRRFELTIGIGYGDDMAQARDELLALAAGDERVLSDPKAVTYVKSLDDSAVSITLRVWVNTIDYLGLTWDLTERAKSRFDEVGITIPYPQREVTQWVAATPPKKKTRRR